MSFATKFLHWCAWPTPEASNRQNDEAEEEQRRRDALYLSMSVAIWLPIGSIPRPDDHGDDDAEK